MARRPPGRARGVFATSPRARAGVGARPRVDSLRNAGGDALPDRVTPL